MVDTKDLKSFGHYGCAGSSPAPGTEIVLIIVRLLALFFFEKNYLVRFGRYKNFLLLCKLNYSAIE